ncbi:MAG: thioredoxin domain-containing protein [Leptospiraceae bacterium]|nr:thioredoxin domain-containing protein [Leptospiraceae bacterium]MCB1315818.1 thioredoxin domain-containing protein [Leptospiraceae bacterium]
MNHLKRFSILISIIGFMLVTLVGCDQRPSVVVGGTTYDIDDLKAEDPGAYGRLQNEYNQNLMNALQNLAAQKIWERGAEEKGLSVEDYKNQIRTSIPEATEEEIRQTYDQFKSSPNFTGESYAALRDRIANHLQSQRADIALRSEFQQLVENYGFDVQPAPILRQEVAVGDDPVRLNPDAPVTVVEFSDFDCYFCRKVQPTAARLRAEYGDKLRWVVKDFPLDQLHPDARGAHLVANCVYRQDQNSYWKFFDEVFRRGTENREQTMQRENLIALAGTLGIDMQELQNCLDDPAINQEINDDIQYGQTIGVGGTPAFFINGIFLDGARPYEDFKEVIEAEL